jgi:cytochrome c peroxidase
MNRRILSVICASLVTGALLLLYAHEGQQRPSTPIGIPLQLSAPLGLPSIPIPTNNPPTAETIALGRRLYYDPILSVDNSVSCASCHNPDSGFADPKPRSIGVGHKFGERNSPTVLNSVYYAVQFWDGRAASLEKQVEGPVKNPVEMAHSLQGASERLNGSQEYRADFERAFGPGAITGSRNALPEFPDGTRARGPDRLPRVTHWRSAGKFGGAGQVSSFQKKVRASN